MYDDRSKKRGYPWEWGIKWSGYQRASGRWGNSVQYLYSGYKVTFSENSLSGSLSFCFCFLRP